MAATQNGHTNGVNGHAHSPEAAPFKRFSTIPAAMDIPVSSGDVEEAVEVDLEDLMDDPTELCTLLENENVAKNYWMTIALAYAKQQKLHHAVDILTKGLGALSRARPEDKLTLLACLCWLHLWQCRDAPRLKPEDPTAADVRTKDHYIHAATTTLNEASRISPTYPPLFLARGVLYLLRASLQPSKAGSASRANSDRIDTLQQAAKCFEDALRASQGRNMMAVMGKARALFSLGKYPEALVNYQTALERAPDLQDPDPRLGIGCCFWQLGHKEDALQAWQRSLELNPQSKIANILLGLYHLDHSAQYPTADPDFQLHYKKAMTQYTQTAWKMDNKFPLTCATFGNYFLLRKAWPTVDRLARQAVQATDVNAIASDGWYLLARKEHYEDNIALATDYYNRADQARGGDDKGYMPAKFGAAQLKIMTKDYSGAKFRLEKIVQQSKSVEALTLLGLLYAEDVYANEASAVKEDKSADAKKAISLLEQVRVAWKDSKRKLTPDSAVLLNLARLYETESPDKSLQCLQQVEQMELDDIPDDERPDDVEDKAAMNAILRESLPPQLLNNMASFHYHAERFSQARELFQSALNACVRIGDRDSMTDTDALVTTISYNLARTYEAEGLIDEAKKVYEGLLARHPSYTDARTRLAYILLQQDPLEAGSKAVRQLMDSDPNNLDVRALYGWFVHRSKKRTPNIAEDQEQRHYKHTLQQHDKHDRYSLTGMGNLFLQSAREMRRDTDQEKDKRAKTYQRAIEFFEKALQLDPGNAYAAQGIGIALVEDKKDHASAIQVFTKVRECMRDASVFVNLGHVFCEVKQYARAIESYEAALAKDRTQDFAILACLGRVWLLRGKQEKSVSAMKTALEFSSRALDTAPDNIAFRFNVAYVQAQIAQLIITMPEASRTLVELEAAAAGLEESTESLLDIAKSPNPPFPRHDIEQRANMGRNTMRKQIERAMQSQREYEAKNAARLEQARQVRETEMRAREAEKRAAEEAAAEQRRKIREERERMMEEDRLMVDAKVQEERARAEAEYTTDEETGERKKREKKKGGAGGKRKKKGEESDTDPDRSDAELATGGGGRKSRGRSTSATTPAASADENGEERPKKKKRRKLERKSKVSAKFKSDEKIVDSGSEDDGEAVTAMNDNAALAKKVRKASRPAADAEAVDALDEDMGDGDEGEERVVERRRKKTARVVDDDDENEDAAVATPVADVSMVDESGPGAGNEDALDS